MDYRKNEISIIALTKLSIIVVLVITRYEVQCERKIMLPSDILMGTASSSYQIEGAWNEDGKTPSIWDHFTHKFPNKICDRSNGDIACDSYHKIREDIQLIKNVGFQYYRFSVAWPRILPTGFSNIINQAGIDHYNKLINELLENNITPVLTIYHWELPQSLQELGGFVNPEIVNWLEDYACVLFTYFGDRVKHWITINEPKQICDYGYGVALTAPGLEQSGISDYICGHHVLQAHARIYHLYDEVFRPSQKGIISIALLCEWSEAASNKTEDIESAERRRQFEFGIYAHPIYHKDGDYPHVVKDFVAKRSKAENFPRSRLPQFTAEEVDYIKGTWDFFGLNHYTTVYAKSKMAEDIDDPSFEKDITV